ncbi:CheR family methyltransferase [Legionella sp. CNM-4043-24]|uniref:CheR family methyltransferase n=1 Tax=Legionella sp. CNM-4043-24 TaxID=3421646 RepID=UPI00403AFD3D
MNPADFDFIRQFIKNEAAIIIEPGKEYFVESRLNPVVKDAGYPSLEGLISDIRCKPIEDLKLKVIDALTINETLFFRDIHPFEALKNTILPAILAKKGKDKKLNIWCAASSGGQEPYTIAMILKEHDDSMKDWTINFIASDISETMLAKAKEGIYNQLEVNRGLPVSYLMKYFKKNGSNWQINDDIRRMVRYQKINLMSPWLLPTMDLVFMRNVLIYFNIETKKNIFKRVEKMLHPDGYFFLGGAETTLGISDEFERTDIHRVSCYQLKKGSVR